MNDTFPTTRYQGSKAKLIDWLWSCLVDVDFSTCLDAFGGTGAVAYRLKQAGKAVAYNDTLRFNYHIGKALVENDRVRLAPEEVAWLLARHEGTQYPRFVQETFADIYFTAEENAWIDRTITNIRRLHDPYKFALAFFALCQACIIKRPFNLFHRKNLYLRLADVERSFGNKATWDKPFEGLFRRFVEEANAAVFANGRRNRAYNIKAHAAPGVYDLVYIDPPYISRRGHGIDYHAFYHFLEGLACYDRWSQSIDYRAKHRRLKRVRSPWTDKRRIYGAFARVFERFRASVLVVSYRSDGIPAEDELAELLRCYKRRVRVERFGAYQYALSKNRHSKEILLIGT